MSSRRQRIRRDLRQLHQNMSSFKGRYNDTTMAPEMAGPPPDPPSADVPQEDYQQQQPKESSLLSPIVNFATGDTAACGMSTTSTKATASVMSHSNNSHSNHSTIHSTNNSTTSTISDDDDGEEYIGDVDEELSSHDTVEEGGNNNNHNNNNGNGNGRVRLRHKIGNRIARSRNGNGGGGRRKNPFGAIGRRLGKNKSAPAGGGGAYDEVEQQPPRTKEQLSAAVSAALDAFGEEEDGNNQFCIAEDDDGEVEEEEEEEHLVDPIAGTVKPLPLAPTNTYDKKHSSPVAEAFQTSAIVLTQVVADIGMAAAEAEAEANGWDVTICISDTVGIPIQVKRNTDMIGTAASFDLAVGKAKMASMFGRPTGRPGATPDPALVSLYPYLHMSGGVPLILNGTCCGSVGVSSGALITQGDQEADEQVAWAAVKAMADIYWSYQVLASSGEQ